MLGRSQPDARCDLLLLDQALVLIAQAKKRQAHLYLYFKDLASFQPDGHSSEEYAYEMWDRGVPDGPRALAFAIKRNRRGTAFVASLEEAVRRQRPDLLSGHGSAEIDLAGRSFIEPSDLWSPVERPPAAERLTAVLGGVYRKARRKPEEQIRQLLDHELGAAGLSWPPESKDDFVHSLAAEPPWLLGVLLRPFYRRKRTSQRRAREADVPPGRRPQLDDLVNRLAVLPGVSQVSWNSLDCDRVIYVSLDPWSDETAEQVRQQAAPRAVRFTN